MSPISIIPSAFVTLAAAVATGFATDVLFDDFTGAELDTSRWLIAEKQWGGDNGGVIHENVSVSNGLLHLTGHGDLYSGRVYGVDHYGMRLSRVTRVGAAIATRNYFDDLGKAMNDGQFHTYRFDWHTANPTVLSLRVGEKEHIKSGYLFVDFTCGKSMGGSSFCAFQG